MGKEYKEGEARPESKQQLHRLGDMEGFLEDVRWSGDKSRSSVNRAFTGNLSQF